MKQFGETSAIKLGRREWSLKWIKIYNSYGLVLFAAAFIKSSIVILVYTQSVSKLGWLDCFLPGRLLMSSRVPETGRLMSFIAYSLLFYNRLNMTYFISKDFNIFCIAIYIRNSEHLKQLQLKPFSLSWWLNSDKKSKKIKEAQLDTITKTDKIAQSKLARLNVRQNSFERDLESINELALGEYCTNLFSGSKPVQRRHRGEKVLDIYAKLHLFWLFLLMFALTSLTLFVGSMIATTIFTRQGFELTYSHCVDYLVVQKSKHQSDTSLALYDYIYPIQINSEQLYMHRRNRNESIPLFLTLKNFVPMNLYHSIRILLDIFENMLCWYGMITCYAYYLYYTVCVTVDCNFYARHLVDKMGELRCKLRESSGLENQLEISEYLQQISDSSGMSTNTCRIMAGANKMRDLQYQSPFIDEITEIQASILDYFSLVAFYNTFVGLSALAHIVTWVFYTFIIFVRTLRPTGLESVASFDNNVQAEFYLFFSWCFLMVLLTLASSSTLVSRSQKLYGAITNAMILDNGHLTSKTRWMTLASHFYPKQMHCFTLLGYTKLSWLFCMKVSWYHYSSEIETISYTW